MDMTMGTATTLRIPMAILMITPMIRSPMSIDPETIAEPCVLANSAHQQGTVLLRLLTWLSPAFPLGTFSYSHGLETAISEGICHDMGSVGDWIEHLVTMGSAKSDAILLAHAWRIGSSDMNALIELNDLALALSASKERHVEISQQGMAFFKASAAWPTRLQEQIRQAEPDAIALPIIMGATAKEHGIDLGTILPASLHAFASNLISVAMRLVPLGQSDGLKLQARLEAAILASADDAAAADLEDLGSSCFHSDIAAMRHETLYTRIFRS
ncbi:urease accessory protein UreF [Cohaesibacter marisflavi]|nr:urease accessory UreF family protein [Cohaesibacter marisflavi]